MLTSNLNIIGVRFTGKNYSVWEFQFHLFVMGKELWGHIHGNDPAPTEVSKLAQWQVKDARVMTWILGSVDQLLVPNLRPYKTAKSMWEYLKKVYSQDSTAKSMKLVVILRVISPFKITFLNFRTYGLNMLT